jgi:hypothetical protein
MKSNWFMLAAYMELVNKMLTLTLLWSISTVHELRGDVLHPSRATFWISAHENVACSWFH